MERQVWLPESLPRKKTSERKLREEEAKKKKRKNKEEEEKDDEEPDISELLEWLRGLFGDSGDRESHYDVVIPNSTYKMGGGG